VQPLEGREALLPPQAIDHLQRLSRPRLVHCGDGVAHPLREVGGRGLGQALPLEELNLLTAGAPFGWPHCYGDRQPDYSMGGSEPLCAGTVAPVVGFIAHSSPIGAAFYSDTRFPAPYPGGLFVALHGTYDQYLPTGTSIVFLPFSQGYPTGEVQGFVEGWLMPDSRRWAMPVDIVTAPDGSLLVSDEGGGRIYRVFYFGPPATPTPIP